MPPHLDISTAGEPSKEKRRIALTSVLAAIFLTGLKLVVGLETNSLGLLSEAAHSGLDFLAALLTYIAVRVADRPADMEHQYGHGKIENLSAFIETILLILTCTWIIWEAINRLTGGETHVEASVWSFVVIGVFVATIGSFLVSVASRLPSHASRTVEERLPFATIRPWVRVARPISLCCPGLR